MIDICVLAYNNPDITFRCLAAIELFAPKPHRVILIDNGSQDAVSSLKDVVEARGHTYLRVEPNAGPYAGANAGVREVRSEQFVFMCNDIVIMPGCIEAMLEGLSENFPYVGSVGLVMDTFSFAETMSTAAVRGMFNYRALRAGVHFSCFAAYRSLFNDDSVGAFDEQFAITFGDTDWEERYRLKGGVPMQATHSVCYHGQGVTRKRGGLDADLERDLADHHRFLAKWAGTPVAARHPLEGAEVKQTAHAAFHNQGER